MAADTETRPARRSPSGTAPPPAEPLPSNPPRERGPMSQPSKPRTGGRTQQGTQRKPRATTARGQRGERGPAGPPGKPARAARPSGPTRTNYQPVILAEFVAATVLTAATPFAQKNKAGLSPYAGKDMLQLVAIMVLYLILALVSTGGRGAGRIAAWFGGLILIAVGLGEAATIAKTLDVFGTGGTAAEAGGTGIPGVPPPQPPLLV